MWGVAKRKNSWMDLKKLTWERKVIIRHLQTSSDHDALKGPWSTIQFKRIKILFRLLQFGSFKDWYLWSEGVTSGIESETQLTLLNVELFMKLTFIFCVSFWRGPDPFHLTQESGWTGQKEAGVVKLIKTHKEIPLQGRLITIVWPSNEVRS